MNIVIATTAFTPSLNVSRVAPDTCAWYAASAGLL
jgi:hypothetical protein